MYKITMLLSVLFLMFSCSGSKQTAVTSYTEKDFGDELNKEYTKEVGANMITKINGKIYDAIKISSDVGSSLNYNKEIKKDDIFVKRSTIEGYSLYFNRDGNKTYGIALPDDGTQPKTFLNTGGIKIYTRKNEIKFTKITYPDAESSYFRQEFMYNGKSGNTVKFTYREYADDLARPAFTQDLQYDLNDSNIIGFKGLRVDVIKAGNVEITYKILKKFEQ